MGHTRLGKIPKTRKWTAVVATLTSGPEPAQSSDFVAVDEVERVASQTLDAAAAGLDKAINDLGLQYTFYLLTQLVLAARRPDWQQHLQPVGIHLPADATLFDLTADVQTTIDNYLVKHSHSTDISEIAQKAIGDALSVLVAPKARSLFGEGRDELQIALRELSTKKGFADLGQHFFGQFMSRFLNFYLSRITADGVGNSVLQQFGDLTSFNEALQNN